MATAKTKKPERTPTVRWGDIFEDPDMVGATEYIAIHDAIKDCDAVGGIPFADADPDEVMTQEQLDYIEAMLEEFLGHSTELLSKIKSLKK